MKKIAVWLLILALMLSLSACGDKAETTPADAAAPAGQEEAQNNETPAQEETPAAEEPAETKDEAPEDAGEPEKEPETEQQEGDESTDLLDFEPTLGPEYVFDADWCEYDGVYLPVLNREFFSDELADQVEAEMKDLYELLTTDLWDFEEEGGHGPSAEYYVYDMDNLVSVLVAYDQASFADEFYQAKCYCIDLDEQRILHVNDVCSRYGFDSDMLRKQVSDVQLAYYSFYKKFYYDFEADEITTIEDCIEKDMASLDKLLQETPQNVLALDDDIFAICMEICNPGAGAGYEITLIYLGNDPDYVAYYNAPYGADLYLLAEPSEEYLDMYPPDETWILDEDEYAETSLFVNNYGVIDYRLERMEAGEDANGNFTLTATEILAEGSLGFADTMLLKLDRPEGVPKYRLVLIDPDIEEAEASTEYLFSYNGRFGTMAIEYIPFDVGVG